MRRYELETNCTNFTIHSKSIILESKKEPAKLSIFGTQALPYFFNLAYIFYHQIVVLKPILDFMFVNFYGFGTLKTFFWMVRRIVSNFKFFASICPKPQNISRKQEQLSLNKGNMKKRKFGWMVIGRSHSIPNNQNFFLVQHWLPIEIIFGEII